MKKLLFLFVVISTFTLASFAYNYLAKVGSAINLDDSNVPEIILKADSCYSPYVENEVISIFKENDPYYKYIDLKSLDSINIQEKEQIAKDEKNFKNFCSGIITLTSGFDGFKPVNDNENNLFYSQIYTNRNNSQITKYTFYKIPVFYASQMLDGKNSVEINEFSLGEFSCKGICKTASIINNNVKIDKQQAIITEKKEIESNIVYSNNEIIQTQDSNNIIKSKKIKKRKIKVKKDKKKIKFKFFHRNKDKEI